MARYFAIAGGVYFLCYSALSSYLTRRGVDLKRSPWPLIRKEIKFSIVSALIFALYAAFIMVQYDAGGTCLYSSLSQYGTWYLTFSFVVVLVLQDTYFYFIHRLSHHPLLFRWIHYGHHSSNRPTPWTSFAFDLPEALIQGFFFIGIVYLIPLHFITLIAVLMTMTIWAVISHLGFNLFPPAAHRWLGQWLIGPAHHTLHHRKYRYHYGLYFTIWDRLLGTQDPSYDCKPD